MNKNIIFAIVLVIVLGVIGYIQITKPKSFEINSGNAEPIALMPSSDKDSKEPKILTKNHTMSIQEKSKKYSPAVELVPDGEFMNTIPFTLKSLIGKKVNQDIAADSLVMPEMIG